MRYDFRIDLIGFRVGTHTASKLTHTPGVDHRMQDPMATQLGAQKRFVTATGFHDKHVLRLTLDSHTQSLDIFCIILNPFGLSGVRKEQIQVLAGNYTFYNAFGTYKVLKKSLTVLFL